MTLAAGERLGPYEILASIGAGGMGEVYRARDTKLDRDVAVKVLPPHLTDSPEALARFEREAKAVAALSHPNILAIFDFGRQDGAVYAVMELLEGETLRSRLSAGALPVKRAVEYAVQIAHGLAAAHGKGIVHRDLKPENLFVTAGGHVKILDFGLARVTGTDADGTRSPTAVAATEPGTVMGTVGYMSPEQVRGQPADHRSDIFSFGAILYEMLSGRRAFQGESAAETMAAIAKEAPPEISISNLSVPAGLHDVVHHCLEKVPAERFQTAADLAFALQAVSGHSTPRGQPAVAAAKTRRPLALLFGVAAAAAALAAAAFLAVTRSGRVESPAFQRLTFRRGIVDAARFSADGHTIVYSAAWNGAPFEVFGTRADSTESRALGYADAGLLSLSPGDAMALALKSRTDPAIYWSVASGTLAQAPLAGGAPHDVLEGVQFADFSPDGKSLAVVRLVGGKERLEYPIGTVLYETSGWIGDPKTSPSGDRVAFLDYVARGWPGGSVCVVDRRGQKTTLASGFRRQQGLAWSPGGNEVWFTATRTGSARALYAVSLGGKERLVIRVPGALTLLDIARDGRALLGHEILRREMVGRAPAEGAERDLTWLDYSTPQGFSADGSIVGFSEYGEGGGAARGVYIRALDGSPAVRLGEGVTSDMTADGKWILAITGRDSAAPELVLFPTGPGQPKPLPTEPMSYETAGFLPDGKHFLFSASRPGHAIQTFVQDIEGGKARPVTVEGTSASIVDVTRISGDGRFFVARKPDGTAVLYPLDGGDPRPIPGFVSAEEFVVGFSRDSRSIYVLPTRGIPAHGTLLDLATGERRPWIDLKPQDPTGIVCIDASYVTPDGGAYVYSFIRRLSDLYLVTGLK